MPDPRDPRSLDYRCWCGRLRREHLNGQLCTRWWVPSRPTPAEKLDVRERIARAQRIRQERGGRPGYEGFADRPPRERST
jgi:hypothetical protein